MLKIPPQLQNKDFRFIKIKSGTKSPIENNWQMSGNYKWDEPEFQEYLKTAKSYGVTCGYGHLAVIDADTKELYNAAWMKLTKTFTVKTGSGKWHMYYKIKNLKEKIVVTNDKGKHFGEVQFTGSQVLGAGSLHPNGKYYKVDLDIPITEIDKKELDEVLKPFLKTEKPPCTSGINWDIAKVADKISGLDKNTDGSLQGSHPVHGSVTGKNFNINLDKGVWKCFRCGTGGDAVTLVGVLEGILDCEECTKGLFKREPEKFKKILDIADKYGYEIDNSKTLNSETIELFLDKRKTLNTKGIAAVINQDCIFVTIRDETGRKPQLYHYRDGYYHSDGWLIVEHKAKEILGKYWSIKYRNEILDYLKTENIINRNDIQINPNLINVKNGVYDIETDELLPHDSKYIFLYKVPWEYNPKATCPKIMKFFESTLEPEFVKISLEIFGYCLYSNYFIPSVFYLYGTGGNGKSVWSTLLTNMLGANNTTAIEVHNIFENRFSAAALFGKLANVCGEIDQKAFVKTSIIKDITGGNYISAELKGRDSFTFKNTAKIISSCNVMPYCKDLSTGWTDRQYVVPFLKKFRGESSEKMSLGDILSSDTKEMEGLLKISIDALKILVKQKKFSYEGYREKYGDTQAGAKDFLTLMIERTNNAEDYLTNQEIYEKCNEWCTAKKIPTPSANSLSRELTYAEFKTDILWIDGKTLRIKRFCKWRENESLRNSTGEN